MAAVQFSLPYRPAWDANGKIIPGALLWFTAVNTNTPSTIYSDVAMTQPLTNPVVANAAGKFVPIYYDNLTAARVRLYDVGATVGVSTPLEEYNPYEGLSNDLVARAANDALDLRVDQLGISPKEPPYNAVGNGVADDTAAVLAAANAAFAAGVPLDGGGYIYGVSGNLQFDNLTRPWIGNLRLKQLTPNDVNRRTVFFNNCTRVRIDKLEIDRGTLGSAGALTTAAGFYMTGGVGHHITSLEVYGASRGTGIAILSTSGSYYGGLYARDLTYDFAAATDDVIQGIWLNACTNCVVVGPRAIQFTGNATSNPTIPTKWTRGIILSGCVRVTLDSPVVASVDQGIDLSGSAGNIECIVNAPVVKDCGIYGVKLANSAYYCKIIGGIVNSCGIAGYVVSGPAEAGLTFKSEGNEFIGCTSIDAGSNGISAAARGFWVSPAAFDTSFPKGTRFVGCRAIDRQTTKTMLNGFHNEVVYDGSSLLFNEIIDCSTRGTKAGGAADLGMMRPACRLTRSALASIANATVTELLWDTEAEDTTLMHSTTVNTGRIIIAVKGDYRVRSNVRFDANATGYRSAQVYKNGTTAGALIVVAAVNGTVTPVQTDDLISCAAGDYLDVRVEQNSTVALNVQQTNAFFDAELVRET